MHNRRIFSVRPLQRSTKKAAVPIAATNTWVAERSFNVGYCTRRSVVRWAVERKRPSLPARFTATRWACVGETRWWAPS